MTELIREGIDHDPVVPWNWATIVGRSDPVEIVSYPTDKQVFVRMTVGDPTSARWVPLKAIAAFSPDRHEWFYRPQLYYSDNPTAFVFSDEKIATDS
ncbi:hypothetical protein LCGC14_1797380 [marine sediment metagenome]|uniref:Uncharacterized protein n=1 Tax=marine sediment metagenome TaxID=412755 RepID=A0A0F9HDC8_9ZZZZ